MKDNLLTVQVNNIEMQGQNIALIDLCSPDNTKLPDIKAGAHIDIYLGEDLVRQYSLCHDPLDNSYYRIGVLKEPKSRGGSIAIHALNIGDKIQISHPKNLFELYDKAEHSILIGGGIGITPMMSMAYQLHHQNRSFEIHYCSKNRKNSAFVNELKSPKFEKKLQTYFREDGSSHRDTLPSHLQNIKNKDLTHIYICGPKAFMDWVTEQAKNANFKSKNIHIEYFQAELEIAGEAFEVFAKKSGLTIPVAADESILDALKRHNISVTTSCEQGICGACLCDVIEGIPDHRDLYLTDEEKEYNDIMAICCSRAKTNKLTLNI